MRRHTANRDRHVLRVGPHRRRSHHHRCRAASPRGRWWMRVAGCCGSGASACPPPPSPLAKTSPACVPFPLRLAFGRSGTVSYERTVVKQACHHGEAECRRFVSISRSPHPRPHFPRNNILPKVTSVSPRSCFQRADESTLPLERFSGVVRAGEREPTAASDEEHREPGEPERDRAAAARHPSTSAAPFRRRDGGLPPTDPP